jgi:hypothetical protein
MTATAAAPDVRLEEVVERGVVRALHADWKRFLVVPVDDLCLARAVGRYASRTQRKPAKTCRRAG